MNTIIYNIPKYIHVYVIWIEVRYISKAIRTLSIGQRRKRIKIFESTPICIKVCILYIYIYTRKDIFAT